MRFWSADCGLRIADGVGDEGLHFLRARRQAGEIVAQAADQRARIGGRCGFQPVAVDLALNQLVDARRVRSGAGGRRFRQRLEGPPGLGFVEGHAPEHLGAGARIGRAHRDPLREDGDLLVGQLSDLGRRHLVVFVGVANGADQKRLLRLAGDDGGAAVAAGLPAVREGERQTTLGHGAVVAFEAALHQQWADFFLEEFEVLGREVVSGKAGQPCTKAARQK